MAWAEAAFRLEVAAAAVLLPAAFWVGSSPVERALLAACVMLVLVVEVLNTAIEAAIDRMGSDYHELSKAAKDLGSAAVVLAIALCIMVWAVIWLGH